MHISTHILIHQLLGRISKIKLLCPNFSLLCFWRTLSQWDFLWVANGVTNWAEMLEVSSCFHFAAKERKNVQSLYSKTIAVPGILTNVPNTYLGICFGKNYWEKLLGFCMIWNMVKFDIICQIFSSNIILLFLKCARDISRGKNNFGNQNLEVLSKILLFTFFLYSCYLDMPHCFRWINFAFLNCKVCKHLKSGKCS